MTGMRALAAALLLSVNACGSPPPSATASASTPVDNISMLEKLSVAFEGSPSREDIKTRLDRALVLSGTDISEENYSRAGSTLVTLRKSTGVREMDIL
jgi:hypothetical protein